MATKITWTSETWNPISGCTHGCQWCYARTMARRLKAMPQSAHKYRNGFQPTFHPEELDRPARWKKPRRIFVGSMGDLFCDGFTDDVINRVIEAASSYPRHTFQFLTKAPARLSDFNPWPSNAWVGTTVTDQAMMNFAAAHLAAVEAPVRFFSVEPIMGPVELMWSFPVEWVIIGRMTGPHAKRHQFDPTWVHDLTEQAHQLGAAVWHKDNLGDLATVFEWPEVQ